MSDGAVSHEGSLQQARGVSQHLIDSHCKGTGFKTPGVTAAASAAARCTKSLQQTGKPVDATSEHVQGVFSESLARRRDMHWCA